MTAAPARVPCDCLNYCGDDPGLFNGKAAWCEASVTRKRLIAEATERMDLQREIATAAAVRSVRFGARTVWVNGHEWFSLGEQGAPAEVAQAARYLVLMKLAEQHAERQHLVRLQALLKRRVTDGQQAAEVPSA